MQSLGHKLGSPAMRYQPRLLRQQVIPRIAPRIALSRIQGAVGSQSSEPAASHAEAQTLRRTRLEAALLLSREPITLRKMAQLAGLDDATEARTLLKELSGLHDARGSAFEVLQVGGGYQMLTRSKLAPWLERLAPADQAPPLSPPALETLAIVAYRQPVVRAEVEAIRGVGCGEMLRQLMDRDLLRIVGRAEELGRPLLYGTTKAFLTTYGLKRLAELPQAEQLKRAEHDPENQLRQAAAA